jgi:hypothetical protein
MANVISKIRVLWPDNSTFSTLAPWLSNVGVQSGADSRISLTLDDKDECIIDTLGSGYIIFPKDKAPVVGHDSSTLKLGLGDKIALITGPEISKNPHLLSTVASLVSEDKFCEGLIATFALKQDTRRAVFCGQVFALKNARNMQQAYDIHNVPTPTKPV